MPYAADESQEVGYVTTVISKDVSYCTLKMKCRPVSGRHNVSKRCQVATQDMLMPLEKSAHSESVWARLSPSSERRGRSAALLTPSHNSQIFILYGSTNPGMMIEWYQYGRHGSSLPRPRSHNTFAGKGICQLQAKRSLLRHFLWIDNSSGPYLLTPWSRLLLKKLTSKLCS